MTYVYVPIESDQADASLTSKITNELNKLNETQANSVKIACSDQRSKYARAVIIYCSGDAPALNLDTTWLSKTFETDSKYEDMYAECVDYLNSDESPLTPAQRYYARLEMTNAKEKDSRLVLFYRKQ
jgi:hypothetical protein